MASVVLEDEVLRDGLQSESRIFSINEKVEIYRLLAAAGVKRIQVGSFVNPERVPQMANTDELIARIGDVPGVLSTVLVLNARGLEWALSSGLRHVSLSVSASDAHSRRNTNRSAAAALTSMAGLIEQARSAGVAVRAGVQCAFGCVYEGPVAEERVAATAETMAGAGAGEINLADTSGMANPKQVKRLVAKVRERLPELELSLHFHDARGLGLANMVAGYDAGVRLFDVAAGGLGGCPFVEGAAGNVPAEDAVHLFEAMGIETGIDLAGLCKVVETLERILDRPLPGRMCRVLKAGRGCKG